MGSAAADWLVFMIIHFSGGANMLSQATARITGGLFSFTANRYWSFSSENTRHITVEGRRFILLYIFSYFTSLGLFYLFVNVIGLSIYLGKLLSDITCFIINFIVMNSYVFHNRRGLSWAANNIIRYIIRQRGYPFRSGNYHGGKE
ncbi:MAG: GtrA family protein [Nitrospirae bacterium]|nr:GtrA family protein [Nitrospirota bacterium]